MTSELEEKDQKSEKRHLEYFRRFCRRNKVSFKIIK
jgi:hypothetical protein